MSSEDTIIGTPAATQRAATVVLKGQQSTPLGINTGVGGSATGTVTRVATNIANTTQLAANVNRKGASIQNNSASATLFLKCGATANIGAGTESFTVSLPPAGYYEVPFGYTGIIDGISSAADANGENLITEYT